VQHVNAANEVVDMESESAEKPWVIRATSPDSDYARVLAHKQARFTTRARAEVFRAETLGDDGTNYDIVFDRGRNK